MHRKKGSSNGILIDMGKGSTVQHSETERDEVSKWRGRGNNSCTRGKEKLCHVHSGFTTPEKGMEGMDMDEFKVRDRRISNSPCQGGHGMKRDSSPNSHRWSKYICTGR